MKTLLITAALIAVATAATAETTAGEHDWSGPWVGLAAARPIGDVTVTVVGRPTPVYQDGSYSGTIASASAGYDWQSGSLVYGLSASLSPSDFDAQYVNNLDLSIVYQTKVSNLQTLRGRVGKAYGRNLFFATAGLARADADVMRVGLPASTISDSLSGWTAGIGVERALGNRLSVGMEYSHFDLGRVQTCALMQCYSEVAFGQLSASAKVHW